MAKFEEGMGDVEIQLDGKTFALKPTWEACDRISSLQNGLMGVRTRIAALDFATICDVIAAGLGLNPSQRQRMLPEAVYKTGLINLTGPLIDFVLIVANGGRPLADDEGEEGDEAVDPLTAS